MRVSEFALAIFPSITIVGCYHIYLTLGLVNSKLNSEKCIFNQYFPQKCKFSPEKCQFLHFFPKKCKSYCLSLQCFGKCLPWFTFSVQKVVSTAVCLLLIDWYFSHTRIWSTFLWSTLMPGNIILPILLPAISILAWNVAMQTWTWTS